MTNKSLTIATIVATSVVATSVAFSFWWLAPLSLSVLGLCVYKLAPTLPHIQSRILVNMYLAALILILIMLMPGNDPTIVLYTAIYFVGLSLV